MKNQPEIQGIIFDAGRVLMNFDTNIFVKSVSLYSPYSEEEILSKIKDSEALKKFDIGKLTPPNFYNELMGVLQIKDLPFEKFEVEWKNILFEENKDMEEILSRIKPDIKLLLSADMDEWSWETFINFPIIKKFFPDKMQGVVSCEVGYSKSNPRVFQELLNRWGILPEQTVFVDDNSENLKRFENLGGHGVQYNCQDNSIKQLEDKLKKYSIFMSENIK